jgi:hypothetical protein
VIAIADRFARVVVRTSITDLLGVLRQLHVCNTMGMESGVSVVEILRYKASSASGISRRCQDVTVLLSQNLSMTRFPG